MACRLSAAPPKVPPVVPQPYIEAVGLSSAIENPALGLLSDRTETSELSKNIVVASPSDAPKFVEADCWTRRRPANWKLTGLCHRCPPLLQTIRDCALQTSSRTGATTGPRPAQYRRETPRHNTADTCLIGLCLVREIMPFSRSQSRLKMSLDLKNFLR
jgi:hypothetical protein